MKTASQLRVFYARKSLNLFRFYTSSDNLIKYKLNMWEFKFCSFILFGEYEVRLTGKQP